jgi:hypothetical protein
MFSFVAPYFYGTGYLAAEWSNLEANISGLDFVKDFVAWH